jgi:GH24 family phage-related lysozyme (muramidase)
MTGLTMTFQTSDKGKALIKEFERCELTAYADKQSGAPVVGWGQENALFPGTPGEIKVRPGLTITQQQADDGFDYFVHNVVDPLVRKHFTCQTQEEHDACASWVYNLKMGKLERGEYTMPSVFNRKPRDFAEVVRWWIKYRNPGTIMEKGLYRRRLAELCLMRGWPYRHAWAATLDSDPWVVLNTAERQAKSEDEVTEDLNTAQLVKLGGTVGQTVATPKPPPPAAKPKAASAPAKEEVIEAPKPEPKPVVIETPNLKPDAPPKPMEQSKTHKGLSKKESGQETVIIGGTVTGIGALLPNVNALTAYLEKFPVKSILLTVAIIGVCILIVGAWRFWAGRMIAYEGRLEAEQPKV